jgi:hypothetical protein
MGILDLLPEEVRYGDRNTLGAGFGEMCSFIWEFRCSRLDV